MKYLLATLITIMAFGILAVAMPESAFAGSPKFDVCHFPPGNPENYHTIKISENALDAHVAHGDLIGACDAGCAVLCDDGNACTIDDTGDCLVNGCPTTPEAVDCSDESACTDDSCDPGTGCVNEVVVCETAGDVCNESTGVCDQACAQIREHCDPNSAVLQTVCGAGVQALDQNNAANRISYVTFVGSTNSVVLNHCVDGSDFSGDTWEVSSDTNLCGLPGGASGDPRWNDEVCSVQIK